MSDPNSVRSLPLESQTRPTLVAEMFHCSFLWTPSPERDSFAFSQGPLALWPFGYGGSFDLKHHLSSKGYQEVTDDGRGVSEELREVMDGKPFVQACNSDFCVRLEHS